MRAATRSLAVALAVLAAACGGDDDDAGAGGTTATVDGGGTTTTAAAPAPDEPAVPGLALFDADPVPSGELRPRLSWSAVDGAARYSLLVFDEAGDAYWAWEGAATAVHLGGGEDAPLPDDAEGPVADGAASWFVIAHDPAGVPIASTAELPFGG